LLTQFGYRKVVRVGGPPARRNNLGPVKLPESDWDHRSAHRRED
jgi:hypothetical protein